VAVAEQSLAEQAYQQIRELIVSLELAPAQVISEPALMERLGIGRTPVREALRRLAQEQFVEVYPRRGMFVTGVDVRDLARLTEVREAIEGQAAHLAAERLTERDELDELLDELDGPQRDQRALMALDERIHHAVYRWARNDFLAATAEQYYVHALRIWFLALDRTSELEGAVLEHRTLLEAIRDGDVERAASTMSSHVQNFEQAMRRVLLTV
jgi:GntR family transcriptional regulator, rspAB operon transcriptional repressor